MKDKQVFRAWNRDKWEVKNQAMYQTYAENRWPWFNDGLDPDFEDFMTKVVREPIEILDLGTCSGSQAIPLARAGHRVTGTDISPTALEQARKAAAREPGLKIEFLLDDITASKLEPNRFDLVVDRGCYHSICAFQHEEYVAGVLRVLKRGGVLLLKTMSSDETRFIAHDTIGDKVVQMPYHFSAEELRGMLGPHFEILRISDSFFYSKVVEPPARARMAVLRSPR